MRLFVVVDLIGATGVTDLAEALLPTLHLTLRQVQTHF